MNNESRPHPYDATTTVAATLNDLLSIFIWIGISFVPFIAATGITCNFTIIFAMPRVKSVKAKTRAMYIAIAFFDNFHQISYNIFMVFLGISMHAISGGTHYFVLESTSPVACMINRYMLFIGETTTRMLIAAFSVERCIAVLYPFAARKFTFHRMLIIIAVLFVYSCLAECSYLYFMDLKGSSYGITPYCSPKLLPLTSILLSFVNVCTFVIPCCILLVSNSLIYIALFKRSKQKLEGSSGKASISNSVRVMMLMAFMHLLFDMPFCIFYIAYNAISVGFWSVLCRYIANISLDFTGAISVANFCIYLRNIPDFRSQMPCCILQRHLKKGG